MSADNGFVVSPLYMRPGKFGIFYYSGDGDAPDGWYVKDHTADKTEYHSATKAIIQAHVLNRKSPTEYGVHVFKLALWRAQEEIS